MKFAADMIKACDYCFKQSTLNPDSPQLYYHSAAMRGTCEICGGGRLRLDYYRQIIKEGEEPTHA